MPVTVAWDDEEQTIIHFAFIAPWTWDEFRMAVEKGWIEGRHHAHRVHAIVDFTRIGPMPSGYLTHFSRAAMTRVSPNVGVIVVVGVTGMFTTTFQLIMRLFPRLQERVIQVDSVEEAHAFLARYKADTHTGG
jgi:hypothetical protein